MDTRNDFIFHATAIEEATKLLSSHTKQDLPAVRLTFIDAHASWVT